MPEHVPAQCRPEILLGVKGIDDLLRLPAKENSAEVEDHTAGRRRTRDFHHLHALRTTTSVGYTAFVGREHGPQTNGSRGGECRRIRWSFVSGVAAQAE